MQKNNSYRVIDLATEVGLIGIWDSPSLAFISTIEEYKNNFVNNEDMLKLMNKGAGVFWGTGADGVYEMEISIGQDLPAEQQEFITSSSLNNKLILSEDRLVVGSPENVGMMEKTGLEKGYVKEVQIEKGIYVADIYSVYKEDDLDITRFFIKLTPVDSSHVFEEKTEFQTLM